MMVLRRVKIKETPVLHASDRLRWLDGTSAPDLLPASMARIERPLQVDFSARPRDLQWLHKPGYTALWRKPTVDIVVGEATQAQRARPVLPSFRVAGQVSDPHGIYHPRPFDLTLGEGGGHALVLYPSPLGTRFGTGGGVLGAVQFDGGLDPALADRPAAWALLELAVTVSATDVRRFRAQADGQGDFRLSLWRLPPLPQGSTAYAAQLTLSAAATATAAIPIDPDDLGPAVLGPPGGGDFSPAVPLAIVPGESLRLSTSGRRVLAIRPAP